MDIRRYLQILSSRKAIIMLTADLALLVVLLGTLLAPRVYTASATMRVSAGAAQGSASYDPNYQARLQETSLRLLSSRPLLQQTISQLHLSMTPDELAGMVTTQGVPNTELIKINVSSSDPQQAATIANTLATLFSQQGQAVYSGQGKSASDILQGQINALSQQLRNDQQLLAAVSGPNPSQQELQQAGSKDLLAAKVNAEQQSYASLLDQYQKAGLNDQLAANGVTTVEAALPPTTPSKPRVALNLALGAVLGLLAGAGLALLLEQANPTIRTADELQAAAGAPLLGQIPLARGLWSRQRRPILLGTGRKQSAANEAFRRLATSTLFAASRNHNRSLVLTSAKPHAGKSTVVANLALAMAQAGRQVILVDGDLRNPSLHGVFDLQQGPGLSDVLANGEDPLAALQPSSSAHLRVLTAGGSLGTPGELLSATALRDVMDRLASAADIVLWDSPPVLAVADATIVGPLADGVMLVAAQDGGTSRDIERALKELDRAGARLLGVIYNRVKGDNLEQYYRSYVGRGGRQHVSQGTRPAPANLTRPAAEPPASTAPAAASPLTANKPLAGGNSRPGSSYEPGSRQRTTKG